MAQASSYSCSVCEERLTDEVLSQLEECGYVVLDRFLREEDATRLLGDIISLTTATENNIFRQNLTQFPNPLPTSSNPFTYVAKPGIFEIDYSVSANRPAASELAKIHGFFKDSALLRLRAYFKQHGGPTVRSEGDDLIDGCKEPIAMKVQFNQGIGGSFPLHYDNPGPPNSRFLTCILYLNSGWQEGHGGELVLQPFLQPTVTLPPLFNRLVMFKSSSMLHGTRPSHRRRYCVSCWLEADGMSEPELTELRLPASCVQSEQGVRDTIRYLRGPQQRSIARCVYADEFLESILDCLGAGAAAGVMATSHERAVRAMEASSPLLKQLIDVLKMHKA